MKILAATSFLIVAMLLIPRLASATEVEPIGCDALPGPEVIYAKPGLDFDLAENLLAQGCMSPDFKSDDGLSLLEGAAFWGRLGLVETLFRLGADVEAGEVQPILATVSGAPAAESFMRDLPFQSGHLEIIIKLINS